MRLNTMLTSRVEIPREVKDAIYDAYMGGILTRVNDIEGIANATQLQKSQIHEWYYRNVAGFHDFLRSLEVEKIVKESETVGRALLYSDNERVRADMVKHFAKLSKDYNNKKEVNVSNNITQNIIVLPQREILDIII